MRLKEGGGEEEIKIGFLTECLRTAEQCKIKHHSQRLHSTGYQGKVPLCSPRSCKGQVLHCSQRSSAALFTKVKHITVHKGQRQHCSQRSNTALFANVKDSTVHQGQRQHCSPRSKTALFTKVKDNNVHQGQRQQCSQQSNTCRQQLSLI